MLNTAIASPWQFGAAGYASIDHMQFPLEHTKITFIMCKEIGGDRMGSRRAV
jgi:hypothetical protein